MDSGIIREEMTKYEATTTDEVSEAKEEKAALSLLLWYKELWYISLKNVFILNRGKTEEEDISRVVVRVEGRGVGGREQRQRIRRKRG